MCLRCTQQKTLVAEARKVSNMAEDQEFSKFRLLPMPTIPRGSWQRPAVYGQALRSNDLMRPGAILNGLLLDVARSDKNGKIIISPRTREGKLKIVLPGPCLTAVKDYIYGIRPVYGVYFTEDSGTDDAMIGGGSVSAVYRGAGASDVDGVDRYDRVGATSYTLCPPESGDTFKDVVKVSTVDDGKDPKKGERTLRFSGTAEIAAQMVESATNAMGTASWTQDGETVYLAARQNTSAWVRDEERTKEYYPEYHEDGFSTSGSFSSEWIPDSAEDLRYYGDWYTEIGKTGVKVSLEGGSTGSVCILTVNPGVMSDSHANLLFGDAWERDEETGSVLHVNSQGGVLKRFNVTEPSIVGVGVTARAVWVTDVDEGNYISLHGYHPGTTVRIPIGIGLRAEVKAGSGGTSSETAAFTSAVRPRISVQVAWIGVDATGWKNRWPERVSFTPSIAPPDMMIPAENAKILTYEVAPEAINSVTMDKRFEYIDVKVPESHLIFMFITVNQGGVEPSVANMGISGAIRAHLAKGIEINYTGNYSQVGNDIKKTGYITVPAGEVDELYVSVTASLAAAVGATSVVN